MNLRYRTRLILICVSAAAASAGFHFSRPPLHDPEMQKEWFWTKKTHDTADVDFLIYGDSRVNQGVDTRKLAPFFPNHTIRNFGFQAAGYNPVMYEVLEDILDGKTDPVLVLGLSPYSLTPLALGNDQFEKERSRPPDTVRQRLKLYPWLMVFEPIRPSYYVEATSKTGEYATYHPDGWKETYRVPADPGIWLPKYKRFFRQEQVSDELVAGLMNFVREMSAKGVEVLAFRVPTTVQMEAIEDEMSGFDEDAVARGIEDAGGTWITFENRFGYFSHDGSHLHYKAARSFSRDLALALNRVLNRP